MVTRRSYKDIFCETTIIRVKPGCHIYLCLSLSKIIDKPSFTLIAVFELTIDGFLP